MKRFFAAAAIAATLLSPFSCDAATYRANAEAGTGISWMLPETGVSYQVDNGELASVTTGKDGKPQVTFMRPGTVNVTLTTKDGNQWIYRVSVTGQPVDESAVNEKTFAEEVLRLVNVERAKTGAKPLWLADDLMKGADIRAGEIMKKFSHTRPSGESFHTVIAKTGKQCGENIAAGSVSPEAVVEQWMNSDGHRRNILDKRYKELGVGHRYVAGSEYGHYWVQIFRL